MGVLGVCDDDVGVVTVDPLAAPTACTMDHGPLPAVDALQAADCAEEAADAAAGRTLVDEAPDRCADAPAASTGAPDGPFKLASDATLDPSGTLLGTLNRVHSLTWSRHEFSCTVIAQPAPTNQIIPFAGSA